MIQQLDLEGNLIQEFRTLKEAWEATGIVPTNIRAVIAGRRNTAGGSKWEESYEEEEGGDIPKSEETGASWEEDGGRATFTGSVSGEVLTTLKEVLAKCRVDLSIWEVKKHTIKHWTTPMKVKTYIDGANGKSWKEGVPFTGKPLPIHQDKVIQNTGWHVEFVHKTGYKEGLLAALRSQIPKVHIVKPKARKGSYMVEVMVTDHHLGKDGFDPMTLKPLWSIDEAMEEYAKVFEFVVNNVPLDQVTKFVLPTGNDLIHIDSPYGTTTSGTRVASDTLWLTLFRHAIDAVSMGIETLSQYAPVEVKCIPGNHDYVGVLSLSEVLRSKYEKSGVTVACGGLGREWEKFGRNLIGWNHGDKCDPRKAHTAMITDVPHLLEPNQYRAFHVGHNHRSAKTETITLNTVSEEFGLVYEICPSLTPTDAWHDKNIYIGNLRRSKIFGYEKDRGLEFEWIYNKK